MNSNKKQKNTSNDNEEIKEEKLTSDSPKEETAKEVKEEEVKEEKVEEKPLTEEEIWAKQLKDAQSEIDSYKDKYLRLSAEFDNYRKRTMKEKTELILNGSEKSINSILPIIDDLERALTNMEKDKDVSSVKKGIELIYSKFVKILGQNGVKEVEAIGKELNTDFHEAIALVPVTDDKQKGKIIDCTEKGYTLNEKVIRHAKVVVGQ
jgi:molecular chaperone GrpE